MNGEKDGSIIIDTELNTEGFQAGSSDLQRAIKSLNSKVESLGPTFQRAISGNVNALESFDAKSSVLEDTIAKLEKQLEELGNKRIATEDYQQLEGEIQKADQALLKLQEKKDKLEATGTRKDSKTWRSLQFDIKSATELLERLNRQKLDLETQGIAFKMGSDTSEYAELESTLSSVKQKMCDMKEAAQSAEEKRPFQELMLDIEGADVSADKLISKFERLQATNVSQNSSQWKNLSFSIQQVLQELESYRGLLDSMRSAGTINDDQFKQAKASINAAEERMVALSRSTDSARGKMNFLGKVVRGLKSGFSKLGTMTKSVFSKMKKGTSNAGSGLKSLTKKLTGVFGTLKRMATRKIMSAVFSGIKDGVNNLAQYSDQTNRSLSELKSGLTRLKNSLATAFAPILTVVTPILSQFISYLSEAITYIGQLFAAFTGAETFTKAIRVQENYADSLDNTGKAAKNASKNLAGMDELTVFSDNSSSGSSVGDVSASEMFEEVPIESGIAGFIKRLKEFFLSGEYAKIGEILGNGINTALEKINDFIKWDHFKNAVTKAINGFAEGFNSFIKNINWESLGDTIAQGLNSALNIILLVVTEFDWPEIASALARSLNGLVSGFDWGKLGETLSEGFITALKSIRSAITTFDWLELGKGIADGINEIDWVEVFHQAAGALSDGVVALLDLCIGFAENLDWGKLGSDLWDSIIGVLTGIDWSGIVSKAFQLMGNAVGGGVTLIAEFCKTCFDSIKQGFEDIKETYFSPYMNEYGELTIKGFFQGIIDILNNVGTWIKEHIFDPFITGFKNTFGIHSPAAEMKPMGENIIEGVYEGIKDKLKSVGPWIKEHIFNPFVNGFKSVFNIRSTKDLIEEKVWASVGQNMVDGIDSGIGAGTRRLAGSIKNLANDLLEKTKSALDIHSPSKLFRKQVGLNIGYGIGEGIDDSKKSVLNTMSDLAGAISKEAGSGEYEMGKFLSVSGIDSVLTDFSDSMTEGFSHLIDRLQSIANGVTFSVPVVASGSLIPYRAAASLDSGSRSGVLNSDEMQKSIEQGVSDANAEQNALLREEISILRKLLEKDINVTAQFGTGDFIGGLERKNRRDGKTIVPVGV